MRWLLRDVPLAAGRASKLALLVAGLAVVGQQSLAQEADQEEGSAAAGEIEELVVTGSYIKRSAQDSPSPLTVISAQDIEQAHIGDVQELLLRLPYESGGWIRASTFDGGGGQGRIPINLRNLGECATLPLVNGRRHTTGWMTPAGCAGVDTNSMVPTMMLQRVEILKDGSSALYGSDAIAGVVNFITKDNFEGFDFDARFVTDQNTGLGDEILLRLGDRLAHGSRRLRGRRGLPAAQRNPHPGPRHLRNPRRLRLLGHRAAGLVSAGEHRGAVVRRRHAVPGGSRSPHATHAESAHAGNRWLGRRLGLRGPELRRRRRLGRLRRYARSLLQRRWPEHALPDRLRQLLLHSGRRSAAEDLLDRRLRAHGHLRGLLRRRLLGAGVLPLELLGAANAHADYSRPQPGARQRRESARHDAGAVGEPLASARRHAAHAHAHSPDSHPAGRRPRHLPHGARRKVGPRAWRTRLDGQRVVLGQRVVAVPVQRGGFPRRRDGAGAERPRRPQLQLHGPVAGVDRGEPRQRQPRVHRRQLRGRQLLLPQSLRQRPVRFQRQLPRSGEQSEPRHVA